MPRRAALSPRKDFLSFKVSPDARSRHEVQAIFMMHRKYGSPKGQPMPRWIRPGRRRRLYADMRPYCSRRGTKEAANGQRDDTSCRVTLIIPRSLFRIGSPPLVMGNVVDHYAIRHYFIQLEAPYARE